MRGNSGASTRPFGIIERALARDPHNPVLLVDVARAYALRYRYADSEKLVDLAQSLHPDDAHLQQMLGRSFVRIQQFDRAIACYRRSLELCADSPQRPETLLELAKMHERLHDLVAARQCVEEALSLAPGFEKAKYALANIERRSGDKAGGRIALAAVDRRGPGAAGSHRRFLVPAGIAV